MKRLLVILGLLLVGIRVQADVIEVETIGDVKGFWEQNGKYEQKVLDIGTKIIHANKLDKRIPIQLNNSNKVINAHAALNDKVVTVYYGLLPYIDSDDELAFILGHEMCHAVDAYDGPLKWVAMTFNSKEYENKADLIGIDLMVKAGYNPVAAITCANKWMGESYWDTWIFTSHPKTSSRLMNMYKYIYVKYPWALKTDMVHNVNYENFTYSSKNEINQFLQHQKQKTLKQNAEDL